MWSHLIFKTSRSIWQFFCGGMGGSGPDPSSAIDTVMQVDVADTSKFHLTSWTSLGYCSQFVSRTLDPQQTRPASCPLQLVPGRASDRPATVDTFFRQRTEPACVWTILCHTKQAVRLGSRHNMPPPHLDFWPFDFEVGVGVACDLGYPCAKFRLPRPFGFRVRADVRDIRQTDGRTDADRRTTDADDRPMPQPPLRGRGHNKRTTMRGAATWRT